MKSKFRFLATLLALTLCLALVLSACKSADDSGGSGGGKVEEPVDDPNVTTISVYTFTNEVTNMLTRYKELHPDFPYDFDFTVLSTNEGTYQPGLDVALASGNGPDIYCAESAFVLKYTQGDYSSHAATYKQLGIDVDNKAKAADIAQYTIDIGTRDGEVVGLGYQATGSAYIYRRSIAIDTWGTDDPAVIKTKIGPGWDQFFVAAEELKAKGYGIVSGDGDIWHGIENSSDKGWVVDGKLYIDPKREAFLDHSKKLTDNNYHNDTQDWEEGWYADMMDAGAKQVLGFFGPAWLINYVMAGRSGDTYGDWAVCEPSVGFSWGGTWILGNKNSKVKNAVGQVIEWITLDTSDTGLQYFWANGTLLQDAQDADLKAQFINDGIVKDTVASGVVMGKANGKIDFLGGQDMFDVFVPANQQANGNNLTQYDEDINRLWRDQVRLYAAGSKSRDAALEDFKAAIKDRFDIGS